MARFIRIEDEFYILLQHEAKSNVRSMQGQLSVILSDYYDKNGIMVGAIHLTPQVNIPTVRVEKNAALAQPKDESANIARPRKVKVGAAYRLKELDEPTRVCNIHLTPLDNRGRCMQKGCKYA